jgi:hypothetical protein
MQINHRSFLDCTETNAIVPPVQIKSEDSNLVQRPPSGTRRVIRFRKRRPLLKADGTPDNRVFRPAGPIIKEFNQTEEILVRVGSRSTTQPPVDETSAG